MFGLVVVDLKWQHTGLIWIQSQLYFFILMIINLKEYFPIFLDQYFFQFSLLKNVFSDIIIIFIYFLNINETIMTFFLILHWSQQDANKCQYLIWQTQYLYCWYAKQPRCVFCFTYKSTTELLSCLDKKTRVEVNTAKDRAVEGGAVV